jgi:glycine cleavage system H protein
LDQEGAKETNFEDTVLYSSKHTWAKIEDLHVTTGISDYAQDQLGEIIFVGLLEPEESFEQNDEFGEVESVKTASELYMPISG